MMIKSRFVKVVLYTTLVCGLLLWNDPILGQASQNDTKSSSNASANTDDKYLDQQDQKASEKAEELSNQVRFQLNLVKQDQQNVQDTLKRKEALRSEEIQKEQNRSNIESEIHLRHEKERKAAAQAFDDLREKEAREEAQLTDLGKKEKELKGVVESFQDDRNHIKHLKLQGQRNHDNIQALNETLKELSTLIRLKKREVQDLENQKRLAAAKGDPQALASLENPTRAKSEELGLFEKASKQIENVVNALRIAENDRRTDVGRERRNWEKQNPQRQKTIVSPVDNKLSQVQQKDNIQAPKSTKKLEDMKNATGPDTTKMPGREKNISQDIKMKAEQ